ncbi:TPA: LOW QUALITY PROTEIN: hypothetical protein N0F65_005845, partial [Lagenidium giganteum]
ISAITNSVLNLIHDRCAHLLQFNAHNFGTETQFADAVKARGAPLACCVGFIDGTVRSICRPSKNQKCCYSGHKRKHGLKFQSVVTSNGIIAHLFGPIPASRHDAFMLSRSNLQREARSKHLGFYGDPTYGKQDHILCPFKGASLSTEQELFNAQMSDVRVCVEFWTADTVLGVCDFAKNRKLYLQSVGKLYAVAAILTNVHACYNGQSNVQVFPSCSTMY